MKTIGKILKGMILFLVLSILLTCAFFAFKFHQDFREVRQYDTVVTSEVERAGISQYKPIVLAMIYTETKGKDSDLLQSSESVHGETGKLGGEESLRAGIDFLAKAIQKSNEEGTDIWTAVQAYNFGLGYIDYVSKNGKKNTLELAEEYSKTVVAPSLGNHSGEEYSYIHPQALFHNGGHLYKNGGNFFYAKIVAINEWLMQYL
ncbi:Lysozyme-like [Pilibacter termitis]|uniref:Lysozyme-like n=1 Tax=Pilibacter termitis TaxID=263852 RepID=A0A1T4K344_9ENTE|nr:lysozyme family protein [Pilibacter termitis]SJZ36844.1 Lysozyme-like [Pilibacter termitis]